MDDQNAIKANQSHMNVLLISKVDNIQNPCLSLKSGFFLYFIGLCILLSRTNMVPKIYRDLSALESSIQYNSVFRELEPKLYSTTILRRVLYGEIIWGLIKGIII